MRTTKAGTFVLNMVKAQLVQPLAQLMASANVSIDPEKLVNQINSITVYGADFNSDHRTSVAFVRTEPELQQIVVGALAGMVLSDTNDPPRIKEERRGEVTYYTVRDQAVIAVVPGKGLLVGKSSDPTEKAVQVLLKKAPNLASTKTFSNFADVKQTFFFLAVGEGFNTGPLPPHARLLQLTDGGRLVIGEQEQKVFLDLALHAKTLETTTQMQQVVQGLVALGSLGQPENKDLSHVLQSIKVSSAKYTVNVSLDYPADQLVQDLTKTHLAKQKAKAKKAEAESPEPK
jgi:hypothetical protein